MFTISLRATSLDLDTSFGTGGSIVISDPSIEWESYPRRVVVQPDGKIVVMGINFAFGDVDNYFLYRVNADGSRDDTFGSNGRVYNPVQDPSPEFYGFGLASSNGKLLIAGSVLDPPYQNYTLALYRRNSDGSRDLTFGEGGIVRTVFKGESAEGLNLRVQTDGKIVLFGVLSSCDVDICSPSGVTFLRFNPDGTLDTSFANNGRLTLSDPDLVWAGDLAFTSDGKIVAVGYRSSFQDVYVVRVNNNGTLDATFAKGGIARVGFGNNLSNLAYAAVGVQPDGRIIFPVSNRDPNNGDLVSTTIVRLNSNGGWDPTFDADGKVIIPASEGNFSESLLVQRNGRVLASGSTNDHRAQGQNEFSVLRLDPNGARDLTFGLGGIQSAPLRAFSNFITATTIQTDGKMIAAGSVRDIPLGAVDVGLFRLRGDRRKPPRRIAQP